MIQDKLKSPFGKWIHDVLIYYSFSQFWTVTDCSLNEITFWPFFWLMAITWTQLLANHYQPEFSFLCIPIFLCMLCTIKSLWWISRGILVEISQDVSVLAHELLWTDSWDSWSSELTLCCGSHSTNDVNGDRSVCHADGMTILIMMLTNFYNDTVFTLRSGIHRNHCKILI